MHQNFDPKHTSALHIDPFNILDVEKIEKYIPNVEKDRKIHPDA
jgi:hypothetical protein